MLGAFLTLIATALSLLVVDLVVPGVNLATFPAALIAAVVLGGVNTSVKPIVSALSMPLNFVSLGAFSLVVNGFCFWLASVLVPGFEVRGLLAFILGPVILSLVNAFLNHYFAENNPDLKIGGISSNPNKLDAAKGSELKMEAAQKNPNKVEV
jgi:putative membrane protein